MSEEAERRWGKQTSSILVARIVVAPVGSAW